MVGRSRLSDPCCQILCIRFLAVDPGCQILGYQILAARSWATRFWPSVLGCQILAVRSRLLDPGCQIKTLAARSWLPYPGCNRYRPSARNFWSPTALLGSGKFLPWRSCVQLVTLALAKTGLDRSNPSPRPLGSPKRVGCGILLGARPFFY